MKRLGLHSIWVGRPGETQRARPNACRHEHMTAACNEGMHKACLHVGLCAPTSGPKHSQMRSIAISTFRSRHLMQRAAAWRSMAAATCHHRGCARHRATRKPCPVNQLRTSRASMPPNKQRVAARHGGGEQRWHSQLHVKAPQQPGTALSPSSSLRSSRLLHG